MISVQEEQHLLNFWGDVAVWREHALQSVPERQLPAVPPARQGRQGGSVEWAEARAVPNMVCTQRVEAPRDVICAVGDTSAQLNNRALPVQARRAMPLPLGSRV